MCIRINKGEHILKLTCQWNTHRNHNVSSAVIREFRITMFGSQVFVNTQFIIIWFTLVYCTLDVDSSNLLLCNLYTHARPRTHTHSHARTHVHTHTQARTHVHTGASTHAYTHARTHACTHRRTHAHTHTHSHAHIYKYTHVHTQAYIHTLALRSKIHLRIRHYGHLGELSSPDITNLWL